MKTLANIYIGGITLLTALKAITIIFFSAWVVSICLGAFLLSMFLFFSAVGLFLICTHKPKEIKTNKFILIILLFISFNLSAQQVAPVDKNKVLKDTVIKDIKYKLYLGSRGGKYIYKYSETKKEFIKRYFKK